MVDALKPWLEASLAKVSKGSTLAEALRYGLNHWDGLCRFLDDGRIEIDSNTVERSIRGLALTRKNALFAGHDHGAANWAMIASLLETCKLNRVDPLAWTTDVLTKLVNRWPASRIDELMPWAYAQKPREPPSTWGGWPAYTLTTKSSPRIELKISSGGTRELAQPSIVANGCWPSARLANISGRMPLNRDSPRKNLALPSMSRRSASSAEMMLPTGSGPSVVSSCWLMSRSRKISAPDDDYALTPDRSYNGQRFREMDAVVPRCCASRPYQVPTRPTLMVRETVPTSAQ